jgi:hypothetical protein
MRRVEHDMVTKQYIWPTNSVAWMTWWSRPATRHQVQRLDFSCEECIFQRLCE